MKNKDQLIKRTEGDEDLFSCTDEVIDLLEKKGIEIFGFVSKDKAVALFHSEGVEEAKIYSAIFQQITNYPKKDLTTAIVLAVKEGVRALQKQNDINVN